MVLIILDHRFPETMEEVYVMQFREVARVIIAEVYDEAFVYDMQQIVNDIKTD
jgi:hypothetical protein